MSLRTTNVVSGKKESRHLARKDLVVLTHTHDTGSIARFACFNKILVMSYHRTLTLAQALRFVSKSPLSTNNNNRPART